MTGMLLMSRHVADPVVTAAAYANPSGIGESGTLVSQNDVGRPACGYPRTPALCGTARRWSRATAGARWAVGKGRSGSRRA